MKHAFSALPFLLAAAVACAQDAAAPDNAAAEDAVRQLYVCHDFYENGAHLVDQASREQTSELSSKALLKASVIAVDMGGQDLALRLDSEARASYASWLSTLRTLGDDERGQRLQDFQAQCMRLQDEPIPHQALDRSPQQAATLYFCAAADRLLSERADGPERDRLAALSTDLHAKADVVASKNGQRRIDPALEAQGRSRADAWVANVDAATPDERKTKLRTKLNLICAHAMSRP